MIRQKLNSLQQIRFFRYLIAAGTATLVDIIIYAICYNHIFVNQRLFSLITSYSAGLITNFVISKYYVFKESNLGTHTQFLRFTIVALIVFVANWYMIQFLENIIVLPVMTPVFIKPVFYRGLSAGIVAFVSFFIHKIFSFDV